MKSYVFLARSKKEGEIIETVELDTRRIRCVHIHRGTYFLNKGAVI
jgi:hypothetical protein